MQPGFPLFLILALAAATWLGITVLRRAMAAKRARFAEPPATAPQALAEPQPELPPTPDASEVPDAALETLEVPQVDFAPPAPEPTPRDAALEQGLAKTKASFIGKLNGILFRKPRVDASLLDELEEALLLSDVGVRTTTEFLGPIRERVKRSELVDAQAVRQALKDQLLSAFSHTRPNGILSVGPMSPKVILFVGVNGVGKTTTIGKVAGKFRAQGHSVLFAAGDTFRAAAVEQLAIWAERTGSELYRSAEGTDPASVIFGAVARAQEQHIDVVLADTAGRLHTKKDLMDELAKVRRAAAKARPGAPDETWLVVDATTGQNALHQAQEFHQIVSLTGVVLTKLDGTARGGITVALADSLKLPIRFIGVGEGVDDLRPFNASGFVDSLFAE